MVAVSATSRDPQSSQRSHCPTAGILDATELESAIYQHAARWHAVAKRMLGNDDKAADAVQEAYLAALTASEGFRGESLVSTWMHRIVVNVCLMRLRAERRQSPALLDALHSIRDSEGRSGSTTLRPELACERLELRNQVRRCIDRLPADYRVILLLRDIEQLDTDETARALEISRSAVKTRLHRARQALRTLLEQESEEYCLPA